VIELKKKSKIVRLIQLLFILIITTLLFSQIAPKAIKFPDNAQGNFFFKVFFEEDKNIYSFYCVNLFEIPFQFKLYISNIKYFATSTSFPYYNISKAKEGKKFLFSIESKSNVEPKFWLQINIGDPFSSSADNYIYTLPYQHNSEYYVYQGYNSNFTHKGPASYSLDFSMPIGTPICAVREGIVYNVVDSHNKSGLASYYSKFTNFISIYHPDGTYAIYAHLKYKGSLVKIGEKVRVGQIIGYSGNTGRASGPHLHLQINLPIFMFHKSIPTPFLNSDGNGYYIKEGKSYKSFHIEFLSNEAYSNFLRNISSQTTIFSFIYYKKPHHRQQVDDDSSSGYPEDYEEFENVE